MGNRVRRDLTRETLRMLMKELARNAPSGESFRVYLVGGGTAVLPTLRRLLERRTAAD